MSKDINIPNVPVIPLRDVVIYPNMVIPLFVGRERSIECLDFAMKNDKQIVLIAQKDPDLDSPGLSDLYTMGTLATILQLLKLPDGTVKVLVEGSDRVAVLDQSPSEDYLLANLKICPVIDSADQESDALSRTLINQFENYIKLNKKIPSEAVSSLDSISNLNCLADTIAAHMSLKLSQKQNVLELIDTHARVDFLMSMMESEIDLLQIEKRIRARVKKQMEKSQREYYLNEQIKAIQKELGDISGELDEFDSFTKKIKDSGMPDSVRKKVTSELNKLKLMSPMSAESNVIRSYIDWSLSVPWGKKRRIKKDLSKALEVLNTEHYGLDQVKDRIIEYLAVQTRSKKLKGPILCLVGPPGVGKTSLGKSIASAVGRKYVRMALGGVRDEAEIRGHRRTYIGAMPGKIIQNMAKAESSNPLFLLDEIDKLGSDMRGDPSSALLEVLDAEQNHSFNDHYLEVDYDLSDVMFVATSNSLDIPAPLLDRMEVINLSGYTEDEKLNIVKNHLMHKQKDRASLGDNELEIKDDAIINIIRYYTREAGVRGLEREISKICRKSVKNLLLSKDKSIVVDSKNLDSFLGVRKFDFGKADKEDRVGQVRGLAWNGVGGDLLTVESASFPGKGKLVYTGSLGDVMKESVKASMTVVRSLSSELGIADDYFNNIDTHVHVPEGATPKDGPSAGVAVCTSIVSSLTKRSVKSNIAMTGEITLRGEVLPIGGLKEKLLAAHRGNIEYVIIPKCNERNLQDIPDNIKNNINIIPVKWIKEVLDFALEGSSQVIKKVTNIKS